MRCFMAVFIGFTYFFFVNNRVLFIVAYIDALADPLLSEKNFQNVLIYVTDLCN